MRARERRERASSLKKSRKLPTIVVATHIFPKFSPRTLGFHDPIRLSHIFQMNFEITTEGHSCADHRSKG